MRLTLLFASILIPFVFATNETTTMTTNEGDSGQQQFSSRADIHGELVRANLCDDNIDESKIQLIYKCVDEHIPNQLSELVNECGRRIDSTADSRDAIRKLVCVNPGAAIRMDKCLHEIWKSKSVDKQFTANQLITIGMKYLQCYQNVIKNEDD